MGRKVKAVVIDNVTEYRAYLRHEATSCGRPSSSVSNISSRWRSGPLPFTGPAEVGSIAEIRPQNDLLNPATGNQGFTGGKDLNAGGVLLGLPSNGVSQSLKGMCLPFYPARLAAWTRNPGTPGRKEKKCRRKKSELIAIRLSPFHAKCGNKTPEPIAKCRKEGIAEV